MEDYSIICRHCSMDGYREGTARGMVIGMRWRRAVWAVGRRVGSMEVLENVHLRLRTRAYRKFACLRFSFGRRTEFLPVRLGQEWQVPSKATCMSSTSSLSLDTFIFFQVQTKTTHPIHLESSILLVLRFHSAGTNYLHFRCSRAHRRSADAHTQILQNNTFFRLSLSRRNSCTVCRSCLAAPSRRSSSGRSSCTTSTATVSLRATR